VQLNDEVAEEVMREAARAKLERCLDTALETIKKRTRVRDYSPAIQVCAFSVTSQSPVSLAAVAACCYNADNTVNMQCGNGPVLGRYRLACLSQMMLDLLMHSISTAS